MSKPIRVALIYGSTREGRFCDVIVNWARKLIEKRPEFVVDVIDPAHLGLPNRHERTLSIEVSGLAGRLAGADAFIIAVPEYNHSFPAAIKFVIDSFQDPWKAKPIAFVSYGGISGGLRAVEQLRLVFAELHAVTIRDSVSFAGAWELFDEKGQLIEPARADQAMTTLLDQLHWWANGLREMQARTPYGEVATGA